MVYVAHFESSDNYDLRTTIHNPESHLKGRSEWQRWGLEDEHWAIMLVVLWGIPHREGAVIASQGVGSVSKVTFYKYKCVTFL